MSQIINFAFAHQAIPKVEARVLFRASVAFKIALWKHRLLRSEGANPQTAPLFRFVSIFQDYIR